MSEEQPGLLEQLEAALLGAAPTHTRSEVADLAGVPLERAVDLWRSLGFASTEADQVAFGDADVEALATIDVLLRSGVVAAGDELSLARSLGQTMSRLADWQTALLAAATGSADVPVEDTIAAAAQLLPVMEQLQSYVWRRHLAATAGRLIPVGASTPGATSTDASRDTVVGFADIVGFTRLSRSVDDSELTSLVESFEAATAATIAEHGGRVVKTIGDEVMFVVADPQDAAAIAVALTAWVGATDGFPPLRIGLALGPVVSRLGDVYGPVVNVAARLTSVARPGATVVDRALSTALADHPSYSLRRIRRVSVRGYSHLEPWVLRSRG